MQVVSFDPRYLDWVLDRTKTKTTRYGDPVELGPARFHFESSPPVWVDAVITDIRDVALADVSDSGLPEDATVAVARVRTDLTERNRRWSSAG